jgi:hypothetical protein
MVGEWKRQAMEGLTAVFAQGSLTLYIASCLERWES